VRIQGGSRPPPQSLSESQTLKLQHLWDNLPIRCRQGVLDVLVRIIAPQSSPDRTEVTHEDA
jgi:hypothetical protein